MEKVQKRKAGIAVRLLMFTPAAALLVFGGNAGAVQGRKNARLESVFPYGGLS